MAKNLLTRRYQLGYTYKQLESLWVQRKPGKDFIPMSYCAKLYKDDEKFIFKVNERTHAYIYPNDNIKLINVDEIAPGTSNTSTAKAVEGLTGMVIARHRAYASYEQPLRIFLTYRDGNAVALFEGVTVNKCRVINASAFVDRKPMVNREKSLELQRKLRPLAKLLRICARRDMLLPAGEVTKHDYQIKLDDPDVLDATYVYYRYGNTFRSWWYDRSTEDVRTKYRVTAANTAIRKFTEALYEEHGVYDMVPVDQLGRKEAA